MCVCVCACVRARARVCVSVYALRIVSMDTILRFTNILVVIIITTGTRNDRDTQTPWHYTHNLSNKDIKPSQ